MDSSRQALQTDGKLFSKIKFVFELMARNRKILKHVARREY